VRHGFAFRVARLVSHSESLGSSLEEIHNQPPRATRQYGKWASAVDALNTRPTKARDFRENGLLCHAFMTGVCAGFREMKNAYISANEPLATACNKQLNWSKRFQMYAPL
jgi:hypothetical protein